MKKPNDVFSVLPDLTGVSYLQILFDLHKFLNPKTYLEIGTNAGESLRQSRCNSLAIDPQFEITADVLGIKPSCHFMQMTSDHFFATHDPVALLNGKIDIAFLDGMHWYEFLLRDFINVEKCCRPNSIIAIHDCIPVDAFVGRRDSDDMSLQKLSAHPDWWAGDVWKAIRILRKARPDLRIYAFDAHPTGLILITNLNPASKVLEDRYFELVEAERTSLSDTGSLAEFIKEIGIKPCSLVDSWNKMASYFWL